MSYNLIMIRKEKVEHDIFELIPELKKTLKKENDIICAYIFGSYGKGTQSKLSDVDIGIFLREKGDFFERKLELISLISKILKTHEIDFVILSQASPSLIHSLMNTGKLLFSKDENKRINLFNRNLKEYLDFAYYRERIWKAMGKRIKEGRFGF